MVKKAKAKVTAARKTRKAAPKTSKRNGKVARSLGLSKLLIKLMHESGKSVRELAKEVGLSPTVIQKIRSSKQSDVRLGSFSSISRACGYNLVLEKGSKRIPL